MVHLCYIDPTDSIEFAACIQSAAVQTVMCAFVVVVLATTAIGIVHHGSTVYDTMRAAIEVSDESAPQTDEEFFPFWSSFCTPFTPRSSYHESKAIRRKVLSCIVPLVVAGASSSAQLSGSPKYDFSVVTLTLPQSLVVTQLDLVPVVSSSLDALLFILVQMTYLRHVLLRPYISDPISSSTHECLNATELMGVRVLCWSAYIFAAKEIISSVAFTTTGDWLGNALCVIVLLAIFLSQWPLFYGVAKDVKKITSAWISFRGSPAPDGAADNAITYTIQAMQDSDSPIEILQLQKKMTTLLHLLPLTEHPRWVLPTMDKNKPSRTARVLRSVGVLVLVILAATLVLLVVAFIFRCSCLTEHIGWVYLLLLSGVMMSMETMIWKSRDHVSVANETSSSELNFELPVLENPMVARRMQVPKHQDGNAKI